MSETVYFAFNVLAAAAFLGLNLYLSYVAIAEAELENEKQTDEVHTAIWLLWGESFLNWLSIALMMIALITSFYGLDSSIGIGIEVYTIILLLICALLDAIVINTLEAIPNRSARIEHVIHLVRIDLWINLLFAVLELFFIAADYYYE